MGILRLRFLSDDEDGDGQDRCNNEGHKVVFHIFVFVVLSAFTGRSSVRLVFLDRVQFSDRKAARTPCALTLRF